MYQKRNSKIFVLSGKARSGKDVVANVIEEYFGKDNSIKISYAYYIKDYLTRMNKYNENEKSKYRSLLQDFGVELLSKKISPNFLIDRLMQDVEVFSYFYDVIIITDARLVNEIEIPRRKFDNITTIRILNDSINDLTEIERKHITETGLDTYKDFDYIINNNSSLEELKNKTIEILKGAR